MAELKTKVNALSVKKFLDAIPDKQISKDAHAISDIMKSVTNVEPKMWGSSIVGFDSYHYKYDSGHEGDMCLVGFSPRKKNFSLYLGGFDELGDLMSKLGKHKVGKGCLYINKLEDVDIKVLKKVIEKCMVNTKKQLALQKKKNENKK
ncbi:MAG: DUF1801 domain-containing protein [Bacteroidia bacterium]